MQLKNEVLWCLSTSVSSYGIAEWTSNAQKKKWIKLNVNELKLNWCDCHSGLDIWHLDNESYVNDIEMSLKADELDAR